MTTMNLNTYQISHYDFSKLKRVVDGYISATDVTAAKLIYWETIRADHEHYATCMSGRRNELHLTGGTKFTFTKIS